ncbi:MULTISPECIES: phosphate regulon transcriptional regulator PhoB [unclassified Sulfitobacter]|uniref:phosphate regulon transcriptional regulator PhoB n=1 Tax=unclassified Sulfitobacter TaxID=196795 RepID=UPI0007C394FE|nr:MULTISPECIES: phosphate regulon transcriptional regulator PhoB [unclassified Sulfitobacter]KZY02416.1 DNA-binding response regulator [Sulfitobacter sp. HI0023]KZY25079.1 DNA-binding response regulator [Sulfitobacter sp. HI0040]KZZ69580.1 DNA-binding response regulator [Sulfitobacter sp. HI0129]
MSALQSQVLLVDDEAAQREVLAYNLEAEGYAVRHAEDGEEAMLMIREAAPDLVILDWMMPRLSGIEVCRQLKMNKETRDIPVIMLSARSEEVDTVRGLETGADDYVVKPYSLRELMARVRGQLRRSSPAAQGAVLTFEDITLDGERHRVTRGETEVKLGPTEYRLLVTLMERAGRVLSREQLLDYVWGRDIFVDTRTVDVHIARLRKALTKAGGSDPIRTVRGSGYALG